MHCEVLVTFARERKREKKTSVQAYTQGHVPHCRELMSRVWPVNTYFNRGFAHSFSISFSLICVNCSNSELSSLTH